MIRIFLFCTQNITFKYLPKIKVKILKPVFRHNQEFFCTNLVHHQTHLVFCVLIKVVLLGTYLDGRFHIVGISYTNLI